ncbi:MAG: YicC family protein [Betaproteobacteria bacterium]|nr:YicC family protein [Betaproteobacteria bacterium]MDE2423332.1 YicC family protein [Betaproteobacteria bacterium]
MAESLHSMTGFASEIRELPYGTLSIDLKSVNHRFLDIQIRLPDSLRSLESAFRERISKSLQRGKIDCRIDLRLRDQATNPTLLNTSVLEQLRSASAVVQEVFTDATPLSVHDILKWPGVFQVDNPITDQIENDVLSVLNQILLDLSEARKREGSQLALFLKERVLAIRQIVLALTPEVPLFVKQFEERLKLRFQEALGSEREERIYQEIALMAAKVDIEEEISRLNLHLDETLRLIEAGGSIGKKLDFLMQELNREANTLGSKAVVNKLSTGALEMKILIEQMREQIQNIE